MKLLVATNDLRKALIAVAPHADPDADFAQLHRVRLEVGPENVTVSATQRYTFGHAIVSVWEHIDGEAGIVDLSPTNVREILLLFKTAKSDSDDMPDQTLQIEATKEHVIVTDWGGLFPGKSLQLPRYPSEENFPRVVHLIKDRLAATRRKATERLITNADMVTLFKAAAKAYGEPLVIDPAGTDGAMLITCGESFIGMLQPIRPDEATTAKINGWHADWLVRLSELEDLEQPHLDAAHS